MGAVVQRRAMVPRLGAAGRPGKWPASQSSAALKSRWWSWITRSMAPPLPAPRVQFMNLGLGDQSTPEGCATCAGCCGRAGAQRQHPLQGDGPQALGQLSGVEGLMALAQVRRSSGARRLAAFHVDDVAVLGEPVDGGSGQMVVFATRSGKAQVGGDEGGLRWRSCMRVKKSPTCTGSTST